MLNMSDSHYKLARHQLGPNIQLDNLITHSMLSTVDSKSFHEPHSKK